MSGPTDPESSSRPPLDYATPTPAPRLKGRRAWLAWLDAFLTIAAVAFLTLVLLAALWTAGRW